MRKLILVFLAFCFLPDLKAQQSEKISIAVLPFVDAVYSRSANANFVQEAVTKEFVKTGRFNIVDRSKFQKVLDELKVQKNEEFLNSKIVEQGKQLGAEYLITGVVNEVKTNSETSSQYTPGSMSRTTSTQWKHSIRFSYQVIEVTTGKAVYSENISAVNGMIHSSSQSDAVDNAQCVLKKQIRNAVMKQFPEEIEIVKVEKTTKKGLPDLVLINAGTNMFGENAKGDECSNGFLDKWFTKKESVKLKAYEIEVLTVNGKELKREKEVGVLKLKEVQGEFSICEVTDGAKEIQAKLDANQKVLLKIL